MIHPRIIQHLLWKELMKLRSNYGLITMLLGLVLLSTVISASAHTKLFPNPDEWNIQAVMIYHRKGSQLAEYMRHVYQDSTLVQFYTHQGEWRSIQSNDNGVLYLQVVEPGDPTIETDRLTIYYSMINLSAVEVSKFRDRWIREVRKYNNVSPRIQEETFHIKPINQPEDTEKIPLVITAIVLFAMYLPSFNIFITSTAEERGRKILLAIMMTPASAADIFISKSIFYATISTVLSLLVIAIYKPFLLVNPLLWTTIFFGSIGYVAVGTIFLSFIQKQTSISTVSTLYFAIMCAIFVLSDYLPVFKIIHFMMFEFYLHGQLVDIVSGVHQRLWLGLQIGLLSVVGFWSVASIYVFQKRGMNAARG